MSRLSLSPLLGHQQYSLPMRLEHATGHAPFVYNGAVLAAGYRTSDLLLKRYETLRFLVPTPATPDLVLVNFNGMDFINAIELDTFRRDVANFFQRLKFLAPSALVIVTNLADVIPLLTAPDRVAAPQTPLWPHELTCRTIYEQARFGAHSGLGPDSSQADIERAEARLADMRQVLAEGIAMANDDDDYRGQIILIPSPMDGLSNPLSYLAADCIHPYITGLEIMGNVIWESVSSYLE